LVDTQEAKVSGHALGHVERASSDILSWVEGEETRCDDLTSPVLGDTEVGSDTGGLGGAGLGVGGADGGAIVGCVTEYYGNIRDLARWIRNLKLRCVDDGAVLDDVASLIGELGEVTGVVAKTVDTLLVGLVGGAAGLREDVGATFVVRESGVDGKVRRVGCRVCARQAKGNTTTEVGLGESPLELADGLGRSEEDTDGAGTGRLTSNGDLVWVTSEVGDVLDDPVETGDLVTNTVVAESVGAGDSEETVGGQSVVDLNHDNILTRCELVTIVASRVTAGEAATIDPEMDRAEVRLGALGRDVRGLDVEEEAVLGTTTVLLETLRAECLDSEVCVGDVGHLGVVETTGVGSVSEA